VFIDLFNEGAKMLSTPLRNGVEAFVLMGNDRLFTIHNWVLCLSINSMETK